MMIWLSLYCVGEAVANVISVSLFLCGFVGDASDNYACGYGI